MNIPKTQYKMRSILNYKGTFTVIRHDIEKLELPDRHVVTICEWSLDNSILLRFEAPFRKFRLSEFVSSDDEFQVICMCGGSFLPYSSNFSLIIENDYWLHLISYFLHIAVEHNNAQNGVVMNCLIRCDDISFQEEILSVQYSIIDSPVANAETDTNTDKMDGHDHSKEKNEIDGHYCLNKTFLSETSEKCTVLATGTKSVLTCPDKKRRKKRLLFDGVRYTTTGHSVAYLVGFFLLLNATACCAASAKSKVFTSPTLTSDRCNRDFYLTKQCPMSGQTLKLLLKNCEFQCAPNYEPRCVSVANGSVFICVETGFTCPPGVRWLPLLSPNTSNSLIIIEEECPAGFYQETNSYCFEACSDKHRDTSNMPKELVIYSQGDAKSPTLAFCNSLEGYYNIDGQLLINYDHDYAHSPSFCSHVSKTGNPCSGDQQLLPNGTCVLPCEEGSERDVYSLYICKKGLSTIQPKTTTTKLVTTSLPETRTNKNDPVNENSLNGNSRNMNVVVAVIIGVIICLGISIVAAVLILYLRRRRKKMKQNKEGSPVCDIQQPDEVPVSDTASVESFNDSKRASSGEAVSYTVIKETNAGNIINVGENSNVEVHLHYSASSSSVAIRTFNNEAQSEVNDYNGGDTLTQSKEPLPEVLSSDAVVKIDSVLPNTDVQNFESTDDTETTALLADYVEKTNVQLTRASIYEFPEDEEPAHTIEDTDFREPTIVQNNDNGINEEENTERKTVMTEQADAENNITDDTERKLLNSEIGRQTESGRLGEEHTMLSDFSGGIVIDSRNLTDVNDERSAEENTEIKYLQSETASSEGRNNLTDDTQRKILNTEPGTLPVGVKVREENGERRNGSGIKNEHNVITDEFQTGMFNVDISECHDIGLELDDTVRKRLSVENCMNGREDANRIDLMESNRSNIGGYERSTSLKEHRGIYAHTVTTDDETDDETEQKELLSQSGDNVESDMCRLEIASHFPPMIDYRNDHLPTNTENTSSNLMEYLKEDIGFLGNTQLISRSSSDNEIPSIVSDRSP